MWKLHKCYLADISGALSVHKGTAVEHEPQMYHLCHYHPCWVSALMEHNIAVAVIGTHNGTSNVIAGGAADFVHLA